MCVYAHKGDEKMRYGRRSRYPGNGPWRDVPPAQRPGWNYGYGRGYGFTGTDPTKCARFPLLSRWWWSNQDTVAQSVSKKEFLESQVNFVTQELEVLKKKLDEISKEETK